VRPMAAENDTGLMPDMQEDGQNDGRPPEK